ncbi:efflux RND transporter periplasmic adaptor subunit [Pseudalkalibacillus hwajinpoensis]|uniref:efflux RND transporter periplasmic adaptor subunit n=1 Tax=Guptibacillus hwajinpoensis TaxID=208199 RepID=UPI001CFCFA5C|nr:efflux RND transporter periplasmic adaptor subunit [Pseudalkalibacillus hwajinpoensis]
MNRKSLWISISVALILLLFITVNTLIIQSVIAGEKKLETITVKGKTYEELVTFEGVLIPELEESYFYQASRGNLSDVLVNEGDDVSTGTSLFEYEESEAVDVSDLNAQLNKAETAVSVLDDQLSALAVQSSRIESNEDLEDDQKLQLQLDVEEQIRDTEYKKRLAELDVKELERQIAEADTNKAETSVDATFNGVVEEVNRTPEDGEAVVKVLSNDLTVQGAVNEVDYPTLSVDQEVIIRSAAYPGQPAKGRITILEDRPYEVEEDTGFSMYHFNVILSEDSEMKAGTHVVIDVPLHQNTNAPSVPEESIIEKDDKSYVVVFEKGEIHLRKIEQGRIEDGRVEILSGLNLKEKVLTEPREAFTELLSEKKDQEKETEEDQKPTPDKESKG